MISATEQISGIPCHHLEKDYYNTLFFWLLQQCGCSIELKGGVSLSKGFGTVTRLSEDIDISIPFIKNTGNINMKPFSAFGPKSISFKKNWFKQFEVKVNNYFSVNDIKELSVRLGGPNDMLFNENYDNGNFFFDFYSVFPELYDKTEKNEFFPQVLFEINSSSTGLNRPKLMRIWKQQILQKRLIRSYLEQYSQNSNILWPHPFPILCVHPIITILQKILDCLYHRFSRKLTCEDNMIIQEGNTFSLSFDSRNVRHFQDCAQTILAFEHNKIDPPLTNNSVKPTKFWPLNNSAEFLQDTNLLYSSLCSLNFFRKKKIPSCVYKDNSLIYPNTNSSHSSEELEKWKRYEECFDKRKKLNCFKEKQLSLRKCSHIITSWLKNNNI